MAGRKSRPPMNTQSVMAAQNAATRKIAFMGRRDLRPAMTELGGFHFARTRSRVRAHRDRSAALDQRDIDRIQAHLKRTFGNPHIQLKARERQKDSAEVELKGEFIGVIYEDEDEDGSFLFEMAILPEDLEV